MYTSHPAGVKTAFQAGSRYRVQSTFPDGAEMLEEYDTVTERLECRRWRTTKPFGGVTEWEYEIGEPQPTQDTRGAGTAAVLPSSLNPTFHPRDARKAWEWHIRNLPYSEETYSLAVDVEKQALVLRTRNKKYFKVFQVPALVRTGLPLQRSSAKLSHNGESTLVITYDKPQSIVDQEREDRASAVRGSNGGVCGSSMVANNGELRGAGGAMMVPAAASVGGESERGPPGCSQS
ncbi:unnamed protein product [Scytosiphon promiscuus]